MGWNIVFKKHLSRFPSTKIEKKKKKKNLKASTKGVLYKFECFFLANARLKALGGLQCLLPLEKKWKKQFFLHLQETRMAMLQNSFASAVALVSSHVIRNSGAHKIVGKFLLMVVGLYIRVLVFCSHCWLRTEGGWFLILQPETVVLLGTMSKDCPSLSLS